MCGIVGYIGRRDAAPLILESLRKLEYRGYDSAGIAVLHHGEVAIRRCEGKLSNLATMLRPATYVGPGRHRSYALGNSWPSFRNQRSPASRRGRCRRP